MTSEYTISRRQSESLRVLRDANYVLRPIPSPDGDAEGDVGGVRGRQSSSNYDDVDDDDVDDDDASAEEDDYHHHEDNRGVIGGKGSRRQVSVSVDFDADGVEPSELRVSLARAAAERRRASEEEDKRRDAEDVDEEEEDDDGFNARRAVFTPVHRVDVPLPVDAEEVSAFKTAVEALKKGQLEVRKVGSTK